MYSQRHALSEQIKRQHFTIATAFGVVAAFQTLQYFQLHLMANLLPECPIEMKDIELPAKYITNTQLHILCLTYAKMN